MMSNSDSASTGASPEAGGGKTRGAQLRELKARAQLLEPLVTLGHAGMTPAFLDALRQALDAHKLVKVRFGAFKDERKSLARTIAEQTGSELISQVGHVAVFFLQA